MLVEVIIALGLGIIFAVSIVKMGIGTMSSVEQSRNRLVASHYATEGIEAARVISRQGFELLTDGNHGVSHDGENYYFSGAGDTYSKYTRTVLIDPAYRDENESIILDPADPESILAAGGDLDTQAKIVTSRITWGIGLQQRSIELQTVLSKWFVYPLQPFSVSTGTILFGTEWSTGTGITLAHQPTYNPPAVLGSVIVPSNWTVSRIIVDNERNRVYAITNQGYLLTFNAENSFSGELPIINSLNITGVLRDADLYGDYLYIASEADNGEVVVVNVESLSIVRTWDLAGSYNANSILVSTDGQSVFVGREKNSGDELYILGSNPGNPLSVTSQFEIGGDINIIEPYSDDWLFLGTDLTNDEVDIFQISTSTITNCNVQGAQLASDIEIVNETLAISRRSGVEDTLTLFQIDSNSPSSCTAFDTPLWENGITGTDTNSIALDLFDNRVYSVVEGESLHFTYSQIDPSTVDKHTLDDGSECSHITGNSSLLYAACTEPVSGTDTIYILDGAGTDRNGYVYRGEFLMDPVDGGTFVKWRGISWTGVDGNIKMLIRTAPDELGLESATWVGPTGEEDSYYIDSNTVIVTDPLSGGDRWLQVKLILSGNGWSSPTIESVSTWYE